MFKAEVLWIFVLKRQQKASYGRLAAPSTDAVSEIVLHIHNKEGIKKESMVVRICSHWIIGVNTITTLNRGLCCGCWMISETAVGYLFFREIWSHIGWKKKKSTHFQKPNQLWYLGILNSSLGGVYIILFPVNNQCPFRGCCWGFFCTKPSLKKKRDERLLKFPIQIVIVHHGRSFLYWMLPRSRWRRSLKITLL